MVKIRDLGINFIPQTMRPPEIGAGGGLDMPGAAATHRIYVTDCRPVSGQCVPHSDCAATPPHCGELTPECQVGTQVANGYHVAGLSEEAAAQLRQQMKERISKELEN